MIGHLHRPPVRHARRAPLLGQLGAPLRPVRRAAPVVVRRPPPRPPVLRSPPRPQQRLVPRAAPIVPDVVAVGASEVPVIGRSGTELAVALNTPVAKDVESVIPLAPQIVQVITALAPVLDTSLSSQACIPGNYSWPGCAIPGGSEAALIEAGMTPAAAAIDVEHVAAGDPAYLGGGGTSVDVDRLGLMREM